MNSIKIINLNDMKVGYSEELSQILNEDIELQHALGSKQINTSGIELINSCKEWVYKPSILQYFKLCQAKWNSVCFSISYR